MDIEKQKTKGKENKTMKEIAENNTIFRKAGYNICPQCGRHAYAVLVEDGSYRVGCLSCGLRQGVNVLADEEVSDSFIEKNRIRWNQKCLESTYDDDAMEVLGVSNGYYVLTSHSDGHIVYVTENVRDVVRYIETLEYRLPIGIYLMMGNALQYQGSSSLIWEVLNR